MACHAVCQKIFKIMMKHARKELEKGNSVIIDSTNMTPKDRARYLKDFKGLYKNSCCIFMNTNLDECKKRNNIREKHVPEERIEHFYSKLKVPTNREGFTYFEII